MAIEVDQDLVLKIKKIVTDELPLSQLSDDELTAEIETIVDEQMQTARSFREV